MKKRYYAGCIIEIAKNKYLFQVRDNLPNISHPNKISTFGGRLEIKENFKDAIIRELKEELEINVFESELNYLGYFEKYDEFKKHFVGCTYFYLRYTGVINKCNEGDFITLTHDDILNNDKVGITKEMYFRSKYLL